MAEPGVLLLFRVDRPLGNRTLMPYVTTEDAWYEAIYRYERRGAAWWAVLDRVIEIMPAATPQLRRHYDHGRLPMRHADGSLDFAAEAEQRRREWAEGCA